MACAALMLATSDVGDGPQNHASLSAVLIAIVIDVTSAHAPDCETLSDSR